MSDATITMEKKNGIVTYLMTTESNNVTITLTANVLATPEEISDMVDEFPDAVYNVTMKAMETDDEDPV